LEKISIKTIFINPIGFTIYLYERYLKGDLNKDGLFLYCLKNTATNTLQNLIPYVNTYSVNQIIVASSLKLLEVSPKIIALIILFL
jgi:hypothetical protein